MEHPTPDEITEFVYRESSPTRYLEIAKHLDECAECRERVDGHRDTIAALKNWKLTSRSPRSARPGMPALRWAAAAVFMIGLGYGVGRMHAPAQPDLAGLKVQVAEQLRGELRADVARLTAERAAQQREEYQRGLAQAAQQLDAQRQADYASLRRDVETVAYRTQESFDSLIREDGSHIVPIDQPIKQPHP
jgi:hypothetical protein